ncbi:MAG: hypothetical protein C5B58_05775 [Acidobacteria bacterium]|nr:MAG: hypothetical protein C5B58_05775 [Acidobacteriota bacterium]
MKSDLLNLSTVVNEIPKQIGSYDQLLLTLLNAISRKPRASPIALPSSCAIHLKTIVRRA